MIVSKRRGALERAQDVGEHRRREGRAAAGAERLARRCFAASKRLTGRIAAARTSAETLAVPRACRASARERLRKIERFARDADAAPPSPISVSVSRRTTPDRDAPARGRAAVDDAARTAGPA